MVFIIKYRSILSPLLLFFLISVGYFLPPIAEANTGLNALPRDNADFLYQINEDGWDGYSQTSDPVNGWGDDQWQINLSSPKRVSIVISDCCITGDYYDVYVDHARIGESVNVSYKMAPYTFIVSGLKIEADIEADMQPGSPPSVLPLSQGFFTTDLSAGTHLIEIKDNYNQSSYDIHYHSHERFDSGMYPAGYYVTIRTSLQETAAALARTLLRGQYEFFGSNYTRPIYPTDYLTAGKGWDWKYGSYVDPFTVIYAGYHYHDKMDNYHSGFDRSYHGDLILPDGLDCSGVNMWAYNLAFAGSPDKKSPYQGDKNNPNPVYFEGADGQFKYNTKPITENELKPGDLLFFNFDKKHPEATASATHVAMYIGGDDLVNAASSNLGILLRKKSEMQNLKKSFLGFRRLVTRDELIANIKAQIKAHSPITLEVTDPEGYTINVQTEITTDEEILHEVPGQLYYSHWDMDSKGRYDDMVTLPVLKKGEYLIRAVSRSDALPTDVYGIDFETNDQTITLAKDVPIKDIPVQGYGISSTGKEISLFIPVKIDIKPGSSDNSINSGSNGKIPVAILSNPTFNASTIINTNSLTFGHTGNESSLSKCSKEDVNGDGIPDLICHFNTQQTGILTSDIQGILNGKTTSGTPVIGNDSIHIVH